MQAPGQPQGPGGGPKVMNPGGGGAPGGHGLGGVPRTGGAPRQGGAPISPTHNPAQHPGAQGYQQKMLQDMQRLMQMMRGGGMGMGMGMPYGMGMSPWGMMGGMSPWGMGGGMFGGFPQMSFSPYSGGMMGSGPFGGGSSLGSTGMGGGMMNTLMQPGGGGSPQFLGNPIGPSGGGYPGMSQIMNALGMGGYGYTPYM